MNFEEMKAVLIAEANRIGLDEYEIYFMESSGISTETLKNEISSFSFGVSGGVCFRCVKDGHLGNASTELFTEEEMKRLVACAADNAANIENDDKPILFKGSAHYEPVRAPRKSGADSAELKRMALELQERTYAQDEAVTDGTQSGVFRDTTRIELMNSHGINLSNTMTVDGAFVQAVIRKDEESQEAFDFVLGIDGDEVGGLSARVVEEARSKLGAQEIDSGKYDVIIRGKQMRALLSAFSSAFSARNARLGMSLLKGKEGQSIASDVVCLIDDPMRTEGVIHAPFDGEGVATAKKNVIENGTLNTLLYDLSEADKCGRESTANGQRSSYADPVSIRPYSFYFLPGKKTEAELKKEMGEGILITEFKGLHAGCNAVTGDFSVESAGFLIRDGEVTKAIKSFTIAGNFFELLREIEAFADTVHFGTPSGFTEFGSPDVLLRNQSIAGK